MGRKIPDELESRLHDTFRMLDRAFPMGVPERDRLPLLAVLAEHMSQRAVADTYCAFSDEPYHEVINDVYRVLSPGDGPDGQAVAELKRSLRAFGYDQWLADAARTGS